MRQQSLDILYEDRHIIVCVKPAGTAAQSRSVKSPDMVSLLKNHIAQGLLAGNTPGKDAASQEPSGRRFPPKNASGEPYLAVVHRLDQPVHGIMVFAKTPFAAGELSKELTAGGFGKYYRALVSGKPPKDSGTLEDYLVKDSRSNTSRVCPKGTAGAKPARLDYRTVPESERYFNSVAPSSGTRQGAQSAAPEAPFTELDIRLHTGRHHQIRVQLASLGCPIAGDTKYNPACAARQGFQELKLCSYRLTFTHPKTKKPMRFSLL